MPGNAVIRYTLNGANPKTAAYQTYTAPFPLTRTVTVTAYAVGPAGWTDSDTLIKTYTLDVPKPKAQPPDGHAERAELHRPDPGFARLRAGQRRDPIHPGRQLPGELPHAQGVRQVEAHR